MAIERADMEIAEPAQEAGESTSIPMSLLEGKEVNPGDVIRLEVVNSDPDSETVTVKYATDSAPMKGNDTIKQMSGRYKTPPME